MNAAGDASDLAINTFGPCWRRSRSPMPRLRICTGSGERMIPWYSVLEVRADSSYRMFEILLAGGTICHIVSRTPQEELYANFQLERVRVIHPVEGVRIRFEEESAKKPGSDRVETGW